MAAPTTALLVIDMQKVFLSMVTSSISNTTRLIDQFRSRSLPVIFTQHGHTKEELAGKTRNQLVRKWGPSGSIAQGSEDWELIPEIAKRVQDDLPIIPKNTYDAFLGNYTEKNLESILNQNNIERVVICGVMTDCCCETTGRSAFNRGFETWFVEDACGTATKAQHERAVKGFDFAFGAVMKTDEVIEKFS